MNNPIKFVNALEILDDYQLVKKERLFTLDEVKNYIDNLAVFVAKLNNYAYGVNQRSNITSNELEKLTLDIDKDFDKKRSIMKLRRDMQFIVKYMNEINNSLMKMESEDAPPST